MATPLAFTEERQSSSGLYQGPWDATVTYAENQVVERPTGIFAANGPILSATPPEQSLGTTGATWRPISMGSVWPGVTAPDPTRFPIWIDQSPGVGADSTIKFFDENATPLGQWREFVTG